MAASRFCWAIAGIAIGLVSRAATLSIADVRPKQALTSLDNNQGIFSVMRAPF